MMSDAPHGRRKDEPAPNTPELIEDENDLFNNQVCPCEDTEPEPMSEYDVPDEWITYTGEINRSVFEYAARHAENETATIIQNCEEEDSALIEQDHARQNALYSDSSSDEQSPPPRVRAERRALVAPGKATPRLQTTDKAAPSVPRYSEAAPSAPPYSEVAPRAPRYSEAALTMPPFGNAAAISPNQAVVAKQETPKILNDWSVGIAKQQALQAAANAKEAANNASVARTMAEAAELTGHPDAARLAADSLRYDIFAAQNARIALNAENQAKQLAWALHQAKARAAAERRANDEMVSSTLPEMYAPMNEPAFREVAPSTRAIEEAARSAPFQNVFTTSAAPFEMVPSGLTEMPSPLNKPAFRDVAPNAHAIEEAARNAPFQGVSSFRDTSFEMVPSGLTKMPAPLNKPAFRDVAPSSHAIEEAARNAPFQGVSSFRDTSFEAVSSALAEIFSPLNEPTFGEATPSAHAIEEAARSAPFQGVSTIRDTPFEARQQMRNEWPVLIPAENARDAAAKSKEATSTTKLARIAEAAELTGHTNAARFAADSVGYDIFAAQNTQIAINAEAHATQVAQALARARKAAEESKAVLKALPTNWMEKKE